MDPFEYTPADPDIEDLLEESQENERQRLESELRQIDQQIANRDDLRDQAIDELETKLDWYIQRLALLYKRSQGKHGDREQLKARVESMYEALRTERRAHWRDRQDLLTERREIQRELETLDDDFLNALF